MGWQLIESQSLQSSAASVTFSNIPQTYKTLILLTSLRTTQTAIASNALVTFNGSASGYSERLVYGNGLVAASASRSSQASIAWTNLLSGASGTSNTFGNAMMVIPNYTSTTVNKPFSSDSVNENNTGGGNEANQYLDAGIWANTNAITSITLTCDSGGNFVFGSTFTLYGLA